MGYKPNNIPGIAQPPVASDGGRAHSGDKTAQPSNCPLTSGLGRDNVRLLDNFVKR